MDLKSLSAPQASLQAAARQKLKKVFGFPDFRPHQEEIVTAAASGRDVMAVLPTGAGKSLCFQLPAVMRDGLTVIISPLIALMKDQVDAACRRGIGAASLNSARNFSEIRDILARLRRGEFSLLYIAPERFVKEGFVDLMKEWRCRAVVIDEAHCISEWGPDFRPAYRDLVRIRQEMPGIPIAAFTAAATLRVQEDIIGLLALRDPFILRASFDRPVIRYSASEKCLDGIEEIVPYALDRPGTAGIVYRSTRKAAESTAEALRDAGITAAAYHAGLSTRERSRIQDSFQSGEIRVIAATIAFGMGIDKPNIRYVVHGDLPKSLEAYYQETGRAGRDGQSAEAHLFWSKSDLVTPRYFISMVKDPAEKRRQEAALAESLAYAETEGCRRAALLAHFDDPMSAGCSGCDRCGEKKRCG